MEIIDKASQIFDMTVENGRVVSLPNQIFLNPDLTFLLVMGHGLAANSGEYNSFLSILERIGETEFYILEHGWLAESDINTSGNAGFLTETRDPELDAKIQALEKAFGTTAKVEKARRAWSNTGRPFSATFSLDSTFEGFTAKVESFDAPIGFSINDFYVFGRSNKWGIYLCENPLINIIGCTADLKESFANAFRINGNGYKELEQFITIEVQSFPEAKQLLVKNYKL